jgi:hypothetical protein
MTNNKYVLRSTGSSLHESENKLLEDQGLILLLEAKKYVQRNNTDRIRYSPLKQLCNEKLAYLTRNHETDFGGKFENYIVKFESKHEPAKRFLVRDKIRRKESYIIPNVGKIVNLFAKYNISNLFGEELVPYKIKGPVLDNKNFNEKKHISLEIEGHVIEVNHFKENKYISLGGGIMLSRNPNEPYSTGGPRKLYRVSYYYENGSPVFVNGLCERDDEKDPMPFYEDKNKFRSISLV